MANPNLQLLTSKVLVGDGVTPAGDPVSPAYSTLVPAPRTGLSTVPTGHVYVIEAIWAVNRTDPSAGAKALVSHNRSGDSSWLANDEPVPARRKVNILAGRQLYLNEGDSITVSSRAANSLDFEVSYYDATDAT